MKLYIKPIDWEADLKTDFCCYQFKKSIVNYVSETGELPKMYITRDGNNVQFHYETIKFCPFCGVKIEIEKVIE